MGSLIQTRPISSVAPARSWPVLPATELQTACSGNCGQGRRCNCAQNSSSSCATAEAAGLACQHEEQGAALLTQMLNLLGGTVVLCGLAWLMA